MIPFAQKAESSIGSLGESELIVQIRKWLGSASPESPEGIGDDCSVSHLPSHASTLLTTADPVVYESHFDDTLSPEQAASKLLKRNISDIASMGGAPSHAVLSLAAPKNLSINWLQRFYCQLGEESVQRNIQIIGGDTVESSNFLGVFMTLFGLPTGRILQRKQAIPGSHLYVTGSLGGSALGKHYRFEPRLAEGQWLSSRSEVNSCMDLSDGLGKDCEALIGQALSAEISIESIPISADAVALSKESGRSALDHAINDGEDYELLFTLSPEASLQDFEFSWKQRFATELTCIGALVVRGDKQSALLFSNCSDSLKTTGFEHFKTT